MWTRTETLEEAYRIAKRNSEGEVGKGLAEGLAHAPDFADRLAAKQARRRADEAAQGLQSYRDAELACMRRNFFGFDPSYHVARYNFIRKIGKSRTPLTRVLCLLDS